MVINRGLKACVVRSYSGVDSYGQPLAEAFKERLVDISINFYVHNETYDPRYQSCKYVGLTKDTSITDKDKIEVEGKFYKVAFVNPYGRWTQVFLSE